MSKRMRWFGLVSLLLVLLVSACTGNQPAPPETSDPPAGTVLRASNRKRFANTLRRAYNGHVGSELFEHTSEIMLTDNARTRIRLTSLSSCAG